MKKYIYFILSAVMSLCIILAGCGGSTAGNADNGNTDSGKKAEAASITVKMLNVGQGDAILIETGEQTVLVDTSDVDEREKLLAELKKAKVEKIDKIILSHPHADHIGGVEAVMKNYSVGEIYDNGMISTSKLYTGYVKMAKDKKITRKSVKAGDVLDFGNGVSFKVLYPTAELVKKATSADKEAASGKKDEKGKGFKHDPNNESIVGMLCYNNFKMLFTGDAETPVEKEILAAHSGELSAQVLKSPHHGSRTSSSVDYLKAVSPKDVLISLGEGNSYRHPHEETIKKYEKQKIKIHRTDLNGTIILTTDGDSYKIKEGK